MGKADSTGFMKVPSPPIFRNGNSRGSSIHKQGSIDDGSGKRLNNEYGSIGRSGINDRASSEEEGLQENFERADPKIGNHASQMHMARNDSDFNVQRTVPAKRSNKYHSIDRGADIQENEVSPLTMMKKKANVHLQPMMHKRAQLMSTGVGQGLTPATLPMPIPHSESNPLLGGQGPTINDRVKLEKLSHIPSVKSNLLQ